MIQRRTGFGLARAALFALLCLAETAIAEPVAVDIPAQPLESALTALGAQARLTVVADPALVKGRMAPAVSGTMEPAAALDALLKGSGLAATIRDGTATVRKAARGEPESMLPEVSVTGATETAAMPGDTPAPYAGGQVARGAQIGMLGNRDFMDTPFSSTGYTAELIQNQQARTLADVMVNDPSVRDFYSSSFPQDSFFIRGFQVDSTDFAIGGLYGVSPSLRTSPALYERVEVLKGPSALLNGTPPFGAVGGTVNLVPKRATDKPIAQVTGSFASDSQFGAHVDVGRRFGADNSIGLRFNGVYRDGDVALDGNSQELGAAVVGLDFRGESVRLSLDVGYDRQREEGIENSFFPVGTAIPDPPGASRRIFQPWTYLKSDDAFATARGEFDVNSDLTLFAALGGSSNEIEEVYPFGDSLTNAGDFTEIITPHVGYNRTLTALLGARGKFSTGEIRHDVTFNASNLRQERGNFFEFGTPPPNGVNPVNSSIQTPNFVAKPFIAPLRDPGDAPKSSELDMTGLALSDAMALGERWTVILGARLQRIKTWYYDDFGVLQRSSDDEKVSPAAGVVFKPTARVSLYVNYIEGFTPTPSFANNANQLLPPAVTKQVEAGAKADFGSAGASFAVFRIEQPNQILGATGLWSLDGMQRNDGAELTVFGEPARGLRLLGGVMLLDGVQTRTEGGLNDGKTALNAPELNVNLGAEWDAPFLAGLTFTARGIYTGEQYVDPANTLTIPAWMRFDVGARYAMKAGGRPVMLRAAVENVANEAYWANSSLYRGAPRTYLLSATIDF
ncbi:MAG TPA: TonB-dependent siderophore receptor [Burkholderiales bacterium]|nr:TonB-dependent siderophore receptor [Burkholderiales bacterium]